MQYFSTTLQFIYHPQEKTNCTKTYMKYTETWERPVNQMDVIQDAEASWQCCMYRYINGAVLQKYKKITSDCCCSLLQGRGPITFSSLVTFVEKVPTTLLLIWFSPSPFYIHAFAIHTGVPPSPLVTIFLFFPLCLSPFFHLSFMSLH